MDRLATTSARFRRLELAFSTIWGPALLADCAAAGHIQEMMDAETTAS